MDWFSFKGKIGRKDFVIRFMIIWVSVGLAFYLVSDAIYDAIGVEAYFISKSAVETLMVLLCVPSIIKRLRDISWSTQMAWLFVLSGIFSVGNVILFSINVTEDQSASVIMQVPIIVLFAASVAVLLVLIFKPGELLANEEISTNNG